MQTQYIMRIEDVHLCSQTATVYVDGTDINTQKRYRMPINPQDYKFPEGSDIISDMEKIAEGFRLRIGTNLTIQSQ